MDFSVLVAIMMSEINKQMNVRILTMRPTNGGIVLVGGGNGGCAICKLYYTK